MASKRHPQRFKSFKNMSRVRGTASAVSAASAVSSGSDGLTAPAQSLDELRESKEEKVAEDELAAIEAEADAEAKAAEAEEQNEAVSPLKPPNPLRVEVEHDSPHHGATNSASELTISVTSPHGRSNDSASTASNSAPLVPIPEKPAADDSGNLSPPVQRRHNRALSRNRWACASRM